jgi:hypothetical protein
VDENDVELGERYRDSVTGFCGVAIARHEYIHGCTRVTLQELIAGDVKEYSFDAPALVLVETGELVTSQRTGGPRPTARPRPT